MISPAPTGGCPTVHPSLGADSTRRIGGPVGGSLRGGPTKMLTQTRRCSPSEGEHLRSEVGPFEYAQDAHRLGMGILGIFEAERASSNGSGHRCNEGGRHGPPVPGADNEWIEHARAGGLDTSPTRKRGSVGPVSSTGTHPSPMRDAGPSFARRTGRGRADRAGGPADGPSLAPSGWYEAGGPADGPSLARRAGMRRADEPSLVRPAGMARVPSNRYAPRGTGSVRLPPSVSACGVASSTIGRGWRGDESILTRRIADRVFGNGTRSGDRISPSGGPRDSCTRPGRRRMTTWVPGLPTVSSVRSSSTASEIEFIPMSPRWAGRTGIGRPTDLTPPAGGRPRAGTAAGPDGRGGRRLRRASVPGPHRTPVRATAVVALDQAGAGKLAASRLSPSPCRSIDSPAPRSPAHQA